MVHIVSDSSTLYSTTQAEAAGFTVAPLSVTIAGKSYREFDEISSEEFVELIRQGNMPTSSPARHRRGGGYVQQVPR